MRATILILILLLTAGCVSSGKTTDSAEVHYMLGISYLRANDSTRALQEFLLAEKIDADDARLQAGLGHTYFLKKSYKEAEKHYLKALKLDKGNPEYQNNLAAMYLETERWDEAIALFEKAADNLLFPRPELAWTGFGYAWFKKGDSMKAIDAFIKAIEINANYPQAYVRRGEVLHALGQPAKAVTDYRKALSLYPDYLLAHYNLAVSSMDMKQRDTAVKHFRRVIELAPESDFARQSRAYLLVLK